MFAKGTFSERFELDNFPFDVQDIKMSIQFVNMGAYAPDNSEYVVWPKKGFVEASNQSKY